MATLQVRDLPEDLYESLAYLAKKEHRSLTQQTIILLKEGIESRLQNQNKRKKLLENFKTIGTKTTTFPDPVDLIRQDRER